MAPSMLALSKGQTCGSWLSDTFKRLDVVPILLALSKDQTVDLSLLTLSKEQTMDLSLLALLKDQMWL